MSRQPSNDSTPVDGVSVGALDGSMVGRWLVTTMGSTHVWDIRDDGVHYQRNPGEGRSQFVADGEAVRLTRVERWPVVGSTSFIWFDDLVAPDLVEQWRQSSRVQSIVRLPETDDGKERP